MEVGSSLLQAIAAFYGEADEVALSARADELRRWFAELESALGDGPHLAGEAFGMIDAAFAPALRYFDVLDALGDFRFFAGLPRVAAWRAALSRQPSVRCAAPADYGRRLREFLLDPLGCARRSASRETLTMMWNPTSRTGTYA